MDPHSLQDGMHMSSLHSVSEFRARSVVASLSLHALRHHAANAMLSIAR